MINLLLVERKYSLKQLMIELQIEPKSYTYIQMFVKILTIIFNF